MEVVPAYVQWMISHEAGLELGQKVVGPHDHSFVSNGIVRLKQRLEFDIDDTEEKVPLEFGTVRLQQLLVGLVVPPEALVPCVELFQGVISG